MVVSPTSFATVCAAMPDPRRAARVVYPLPAILALLNRIVNCQQRLTRLERACRGAAARLMEVELRARLAELRRELEVGEHRLVQLDTERAHLRDTVLRISGAIQVLEELLAASAENHPDTQTSEHEADRPA